MRYTLLDEVSNGLAMALRRWPTMLTIAGMMAVASFVLSLTLGTAMWEITALTRARYLGERKAVAFATYYPHGAKSSVGEGTIQYLVDMIDRREAYTAVVNNMGVDDPDSPGGHAVMVLFGDVVSDLFPELEPGEPKALPFAMRGARFAVRNLDSLSLGNESIPVVKTLRAGTTFFDLKLGVLPLDRRLVIRAPARMLPLLGPVAREEALSRAVMLAPADAVLDTYVSGCAQGGLFLVPFGAATDYPQRFQRSLEASAMYIAAMFGFLALVLAAFASSARLTICQEMRAFKIREMYGATAMHVSLRIGGFLAAVVLALPVALLSLLALTGGPYTAGAFWVILAIVLTFVFLWFTSVRQVLAQDQMGR